VLAQVYWVYANQVSKTPPTGMFIGTGSFIIRGKRNFISP
jgi:predicted ribosome quality control (RQC) complex YloA/Tae2 family protein